MNSVLLQNVNSKDLLLLKYMQKYPVRTDIKRARDGDVKNYPDTRKNPIKRMKLERVIEFL